jgi:hypothetical protein
MFNFPFTDAAPQYRADTLRLFVEINNPRTRFAGEASGRGMLFL